MTFQLLITLLAVFQLPVDADDLGFGPDAASIENEDFQSRLIEDGLRSLLNEDAIDDDDPFRSPNDLIEEVDFAQLLNRNSTVGQTMFGHSRLKRSYQSYSMKRRPKVANRPVHEALRSSPKHCEEAATFKLTEFDASATKYPKCVRKHAFYSIGKEIRKPSFEDTSECWIDDNIESCNFGGKATDVKSEKGDFTFDECEFFGETKFIQKYVMRESDPDPANIPSPQEKKIFLSLLYRSKGWKSYKKNPKAWMKAGCAKRNIHFCEDGKYELNIRLVDYKATATDERIFDIKLNDEYVFKNIDPVKLGGLRSAISLIALFEIANDTLYLDGVPKEQGIELTEGKVSLQFCDSECNSKRREFIVSGYSVHKITAPPIEDECTKLSLEECVMSENPICEYHVTSSTCQSKENACKFPCNQKNTCYRKGESIYYLKGGAVCQPPESDTLPKHCQSRTTLLGVNFGDVDLSNFTDYRGVNFYNIKYVSTPPEDPDKRTHTAQYNNYNKEGIRGLPGGDHQTAKLYQEYVTTMCSPQVNCDPKKNKTSRHKPYKIFATLPGTGNYELTILTIEHRGYVRGKHFSFRIADFELTAGFEPLKYQEQYNAVELNLFFQVTKDTEGKLWIEADNYCQNLKLMNGYSQPEKCTKKQIEDIKRVPISFHQGFPYPRSEDNIEIFAFSLSVFGENAKCVADPPKPFQKKEVLYSNCIKKHAFYSVRGIATSPDFEDLSGCHIFDNVDSRNLNGQSFDVKGNGSNAFTFSEGLLIDTQQVTSKISLTGITGIRNEEENAIYTSALVGSDRTGDSNSEKCAYRRIHFCEDGRYEINIRVADPFSNTTNDRRFNIRLGTEIIFQEVDIFGLAKKKSTPVELIVIADIKGNFMKIGGTKNVTLLNGNVNLVFCNSDCSNTNYKGFIVSGYTVHKIGIKETDNCTEFDGKSCECVKRLHCDYLTSTSQCRSREQVCRVSCNQQHEQRYRHSQTCDNHIFYVNGGAVCQYPKGQKHYSEPVTTITAIYFGNSTVTDYRNVTFESYSKSTFQDPEKSIHVDTAKEVRKIPETKGTNDLYSNFLWTYDKNRKGAPISFTTSLTGAGTYELSIMFVETKYCVYGMQDFSMKLNNITFIQNFDILRYRNQSEGLELNVIFKIIEKGGTHVIATNGFCNKNRKNGELVNTECPEQPIGDLTKLVISFHFGECTLSTSFPVTGFSIVKFETANKTEDPCKYEIHEFQKSAMEHPVCIRKYAFYPINGIPGKPGFEELGSCAVEDNLVACNILGLPFEAPSNETDPNRIKYQLCRLRDWNDVDIAKNGKLPMDTFIENDREESKDFFRTFQYGDETVENLDSSSCVNQRLQFCDDGIYELSIRAVDHISTRPGQRRFNIKIASHTIFREVDLFQLAGKANSSVYLNAILIKKGFQLTVDGMNLTVDLAKPWDETELRFCFSSCKMNPLKGFIVNGITLLKIMPGPVIDTCRSHDKKPCDCNKMEGCDYLTWDDTCRSRKEWCRRTCMERLSGGLESCPRRGEQVYYLRGGVMCQYEKGRQDYCDVYDVIDAVIMGESTKDRRNISFQNFESSRVIFDPPLKKSAVKMQSEAAFRSSGSQKAFREYQELTKIGFYLDFPDVGIYEMTLLMIDGETTTSGCRDFQFQFNHKPYAHTVEIKRFRTGQSKNIEINILFEIMHGSPETSPYWVHFTGYGATRKLDGRQLYIDRQLNSLKSLKHNLVALAPGNCSTESTSFFNGFSLIRFRDKGPPVDLCAKYGTNCECVKDPKCDFLVSTQTCVSRARICEAFAKGTTCYRSGDHIFYMLGGVVCNFKNKKNTYCSGFKQTFAVNFGGKDVTDYRGIKFIGQPAATMTDKMKTVTGTVQGVPEGVTHDIYNTVRESQGDKFNDVTFNVTLAGEGSYELSVMFFDYKPDANVSREFSFAFNGYNLTNAFDIRRYPLDEKHTGLEINVLFHVMQNSTDHNNLFIHGLCYGNRGMYTPDTSKCFNTVINDMNAVPLTMRKGSCGGDTNFVVSGLSIIKFD